MALCASNKDIGSRHASPANAFPGLRTTMADWAGLRALAGAPVAANNGGMPKPPRQLDSRIEIITPENIAFHYVLAGPFRRLPAYLFDCAIRMVVILAVLLLAILGGLVGAGAIGLGVAFIAWFLLSWFY